MDKISFKAYLHLLEKHIIEEGVESGVFSRSLLIPVRPGKLSSTSFGLLLGSTIDSPLSFAVDYYGYIKPSFGFRRMVDEKRLQLYGRQIKKVCAVVVHFASIKIEDVDRLSSSRLTAGFPKFKTALIQLRGFNNTP